jgi:hypothetical protein
MASASGMNDLLYAAVFGVAAPQGKNEASSAGDPSAGDTSPADGAPLRKSGRCDCFFAGWEQYGLHHDF